MSEDNFLEEVLEEANRIINPNKEEGLSEKIKRLTQLTLQGQTVSEVLELLPHGDQLKTRIRPFLYYVQLMGCIKAVEKLNGFNAKQVTDLEAYLKETTGF